MAEYTPIGQGTYNTVAGSVGLASALFGGNGGNLFGGLFGGNNNGVSKETFDLSMQLSASQRDNAILTAELNTEKKMVEVFNSLNDKINKVVADQAAGGKMPGRNKPAGHRHSPHYSGRCAQPLHFHYGVRT